MKLASNMNNAKTLQPAAAAVDPGILEMGTSVSVNDEMRRAVTTETVEIEAVCTKLASDVNAENATAGELQKSKQHADTEVFGLLQGATESVETVNMNEQILRGLKTTFEAEIVLVQPSQTKQPSKDYPMTEAHPANVVPPSTTSVFAIQEANKGKKEEITSIGEEMGQKTVTVQALVDRKTEVMHDVRAVFTKIKADRLDVVNANAKHNTRVAEDGLEDEKNRLNTLKANRGVVDARNAALRKTVAESEANLSAMKNANAAKEREWQMILAAQDTEIRREEKDFADMGREQTRIDELLKRINAPTEEAVQLLARRDQATKKLEEERFERSALFATQARLGTGITAVTKMLEYTQFQLIEEQKYAAENGEDRPGSVDFEKINADLEGKKATLEEALAALLKPSTSPEKEELIGALEDQMKELAELNGDINCASEEFEGKESTLKEYRRILDDHKDAYRNHHEFLAALFAEEHGAYSALERQLEQQSVDIEQQEFSDESAFNALMRKAKLHRYAAKVLSRTEQKEEMVVEAEAAPNPKHGKKLKPRFNE